MIRTPYKDADYFDKFIKLKIESIHRFSEEIKISTDDNAKLKRLNRQIFLYAYQTLIAMYSTGVPINEIKTFFPSVVEKFENGMFHVGKTPMDKYSFDLYIEILWMLSWCILLDISAEVSARVCSVVEITGRHDFFLDLLMSHLSNKALRSEILYYPKPYEKLKNIVTGDRNRASEKLLHFLEKEYYSGMKLAHWYDDHKNKHDVYFGYWSFEAAAICKLMNINDELLKDCQYYPYDMRHYNL